MALPFTTQDIEIKEPLLDTISCAICIVKEHYHIFSNVKLSLKGTMRCQEHTMQCANCEDHVETDAHLLCTRCCDSGQGATFHEILANAEHRPCCNGGCCCAKCIEETATFYLTRAVEEGCAQSPKSPSPKSPRSKD